MLNNLNSYFSPNFEFYLNNVTYEYKQKKTSVKEYSLSCTDTLMAQVYGDNDLLLIINRNLQFDPDELYSLSVSFGVRLQFVKDVDDKSAIDWAKEFSQNGGFVLSNIMPRIAHLIAEITASYGQVPVVTPPSLFNQNAK